MFVLLVAVVPGSSPGDCYMKGVETGSFTKRFMNKVSLQLIDLLVKIGLGEK